MGTYEQDTTIHIHTQPNVKDPIIVTVMAIYIVHTCTHIYFQMLKKNTLLVLLYSLGISRALFKQLKQESFKSWIILLFKVGQELSKEFFESSSAPIEEVYTFVHSKI